MLRYRRIAAWLVIGVLLASFVEPVIAEAHDGDGQRDSRSSISVVLDSPVPPAPPAPAESRDHALHLCHCMHAHATAALDATELDNRVRLIEDAPLRPPAEKLASADRANQLRPPIVAARA